MYWFLLQVIRFLSALKHFSLGSVDYEGRFRIGHPPCKHIDEFAGTDGENLTQTVSD
jgi:hypothetical protein